jgi:hypothetical protein
MVRFTGSQQGDISMNATIKPIKTSTERLAANNTPDLGGFERAEAIWLYEPGVVFVDAERSENGFGVFNIDERWADSRVIVTIDGGLLDDLITILTGDERPTVWRGQPGCKHRIPEKLRLQTYDLRQRPSVFNEHVNDMRTTSVYARISAPQTVDIWVKSSSANGDYHFWDRFTHHGRFSVAWPPIVEQVRAVAPAAQSRRTSPRRAKSATVATAAQPVPQAIAE